MTTYDKTPGLNWSSIKHLRTSPLLYRHRVDNPEERKDHLTWGSAFHTAVLEPGKFDSRFAVYDDIRRGAAWSQWQDEHPGVMTFKSHELEHILGAARAVLDNPDAKALLSGGRAEDPITWVDPGTGIECKGRIDYFLPDRIVDLKSTTDVGERVFGASAARYDYACQMAWYHFGAIFANRLPKSGDKPPVIVAVEKAPPYDVACYELSVDDLAMGREICLDLMHQIKACSETNYWPGKAPGLRQLKLPPYWGAGDSEL